MDIETALALKKGDTVTFKDDLWVSGSYPVNKVFNSNETVYIDLNGHHCHYDCRMFEDPNAHVDDPANTKKVQV